MENYNLKELGVQELSLVQKREFSGGVFWKTLALISVAVYLYDHWECLKEGIRQEL